MSPTPASRRGGLADTFATATDGEEVLPPHRDLIADMFVSIPGRRSTSSNARASLRAGSLDWFRNERQRYLAGGHRFGPSRGGDRWCSPVEGGVMSTALKPIGDCGPEFGRRVERALRATICRRDAHEATRRFADRMFEIGRDYDRFGSTGAHPGPNATAYSHSSFPRGGRTS